MGWVSTREGLVPNLIRAGLHGNFPAGHTHTQRTHMVLSAMVKAIVSTSSYSESR